MGTYYEIEQNTGIPKAGTPLDTFIRKTNVTDYIPIEYAKEGSISPEVVTDFTGTTGAVRVRKFDSSTIEDVVIDWQTPDNLDTSSDITFIVTGYITEATAPASNEGVSFKIAGYKISDNDGLSGTFGSEVESNNADLGGLIQGDLFILAESGAITLTGLNAGDKVIIRLKRDTADADDDYGQDVGIDGVQIKYSINKNA